ncbi:MAG: DUF3313 domain-containing protein [Planctomycetota bacterium]
MSDYGNLQKQSETFSLYLSPEYGQGKYNKVIIDPIVVKFYPESKAYEEEKSGKIKQEEMEELLEYATKAIKREVDDVFSVVTEPGPDVIRMRIAITNLMRSKIGQNAIPHTKLAGTGLGGAAMEGEMLDSVTGKQVAAVVQIQKGTRWTMSNLTTWGDARNVIDAWAKNLRQRIDESMK